MTQKILSALSPPPMTTAQRDAIPAGRRPPGSMIFNSTTSAVETNIGSDATPVWAAPTEVLIASQVLAAAGWISFSSIPQTYEHLVLRLFVRGNQAGVAGTDGCRVQFNGDATLKYNSEGIYGQGTTATAFQVVAASGGQIGSIPDSTTDANYWGIIEARFLHYRRAGYRAWVSSSYVPVSSVGGQMGTWGGIWWGNPGAAISSSILIYAATGALNFAIGSRAALYGVTS